MDLRGRAGARGTGDGLAAWARRPCRGARPPRSGVGGAVGRELTATRPRRRVWVQKLALTLSLSAPCPGHVRQGPRRPQALGRQEAVEGRVPQKTRPAEARGAAPVTRGRPAVPRAAPQRRVGALGAVAGGAGRSPPRAGSGHRGSQLLPPGRSPSFSERTPRFSASERSLGPFQSADHLQSLLTPSGRAGALPSRGRGLPLANACSE